MGAQPRFVSTIAGSPAVWNLEIGREHLTRCWVLRVRARLSTSSPRKPWRWGAYESEDPLVRSSSRQREPEPAGTRTPSNLRTSSVAGDEDSGIVRRPYLENCTVDASIQ